MPRTSKKDKDTAIVSSEIKEPEPPKNKRVQKRREKEEAFLAKQVRFTTRRVSRDTVEPVLEVKESPLSQIPMTRQQSKGKPIMYTELDLPKPKSRSKSKSPSVSAKNSKESPATSKESATKPRKERVSKAQSAPNQQPTQTKKVRESSKSKAVKDENNTEIKEKPSKKQASNNSAAHDKSQKDSVNNQGQSGSKTQTEKNQSKSSSEKALIAAALSDKNNNTNTDGKDSAASGGINNEATKKKGKRGKKICPTCDSYVPIHSQKCAKCEHQFHFKQRPKKVKQVCMGEGLLCYDRLNYYPRNPFAPELPSKQMFQLEFTKVKFYGINQSNASKRVQSLQQLQQAQQHQMQQQQSNHPIGPTHHLHHHHHQGHQHGTSQNLQQQQQQHQLNLPGQQNVHQVGAQHQTTSQQNNGIDNYFLSDEEELESQSFDIDYRPTIHNDKNLQVSSQLFVKKGHNGEFFDFNYVHSLLGHKPNYEIIEPINDIDGESRSEIKIDTTEKPKNRPMVLDIDDQKVPLTSREYERQVLNDQMTAFRLEAGCKVLKIEWLARINDQQNFFLALMQKTVIEDNIVDYCIGLFSEERLEYMIEVDEDSKITDFDTLKTCSDNPRFQTENKQILQSCVIVENGVLHFHNLPRVPIPGQLQGKLQNSDTKKNEIVRLRLKPFRKLSLPNIEFCMVRILPYGRMNQIAVTDFVNNIHLFTDFEHVRTIFNAHSRLITDIKWLNLQQDQNDNEDSFKMNLASCSMDGFLKLWSLEDSFVPIFETFHSKKWVYQMLWDDATNVLFFNSEGKHFSQKIIYLQTNKVLMRKYNFFSENILASATSVFSDYIYSTGINGILYKISKQDVCRILVKQKEKLKNRQVTKMLGFEIKHPTHSSTTASAAISPPASIKEHSNVLKNLPSIKDDKPLSNQISSQISFQQHQQLQPQEDDIQLQVPQIKITTEPKEDTEELYLYPEREAAITNFSVCPKSAYHNLLAIGLRNLNLLFICKDA